MAIPHNSGLVLLLLHTGSDCQGPSLRKIADRTTPDHNSQVFHRGTQGASRTRSVCNRKPADPDLLVEPDARKRPTREWLQPERKSRVPSIWTSGIRAIT
ncbi:hypothetical protein PLICRDRAFT_50556 [Plicaturopsis crispa FD-325 SS-3]|nr:hypothetical protein PLICRDRAFT_50556 [Plicaturopsis crispa FD-325 SS-3]